MLWKVQQYSIASKQCPYSILGLPITATKKEIKERFVALSWKYHPDTAEDKTDSSIQYHQIIEAYKILSNDSSRNELDRKNQRINPYQNRRIIYDSPETSFWEEFDKQTLMRQKEFENYMKRWDISGLKERTKEEAEKRIENQLQERQSQIANAALIITAIAIILLLKL